MEGCNTAFSWETGQIATGRVHNPHYYEWMRRTGGGAAPREAGDIPCGGLPNIFIRYGESRLNEYLISLSNAQISSVLEIHRNLSELIYARLPGFPTTQTATANKDIDVKYLMQRLTEEEWERELEITETKFKRKRDIGQILQMAATGASDIFRDIVGYVNEHDIRSFIIWMGDTTMPMLESLRNFVNTSLVELAKRERMAVPQFGPNWIWQTPRSLNKLLVIRGE
jgi:hypothetical protein